MKYLHAMLRVLDPEETLRFYRDGLGLSLIRTKEDAKGRYTLYFLATEVGEPEIELTHNWDELKAYSGGRNFGHLAFSVPDIYATCEHLQSLGVAILRPPRDGRMAFIKDPNGISIELLQEGEALNAAEPWRSMPSQGSW